MQQKLSKRNKKMELSYILNNRNCEINDSINDILINCFIFDGSNLKVKPIIIKKSLNTILKSQNKKEIKNSIYKLKYINEIQHNYISNLINILTKNGLK